MGEFSFWLNVIDIGVDPDVKCTQLIAYVVIVAMNQWAKINGVLWRRNVETNCLIIKYCST